MTPEWALTISNMVIAVAAIVGGIPGIIFPFYYHWKSGGAWADTNMGKHVMSWSVVMAGLYASAIIRWFVPEEFLQLIVRPAIAVGCAIVVIWRFAIFIQLYRDLPPEIPEVSMTEQGDSPELHTDGLPVKDYVNVKAGNVVPCQGDEGPTPVQPPPAEKGETDGLDRRFDQTGR